MSNQPKGPKSPSPPQVPDAQQSTASPRLPRSEGLTLRVSPETEDGRSSLSKMMTPSVVETPFPPKGEEMDKKEQSSDENERKVKYMEEEVVLVPQEMTSTDLIISNKQTMRSVIEHTADFLYTTTDEKDLIEVVCYHSHYLPCAFSLKSNPTLSSSTLLKAVSSTFIILNYHFSNFNPSLYFLFNISPCIIVFVAVAI